MRRRAGAEFRRLAPRSRWRWIVSDGEQRRALFDHCLSQGYDVLITSIATCLPSDRFVPVHKSRYNIAKS